MINVRNIRINLDSENVEIDMTILRLEYVEKHMYEAFERLKGERYFGLLSNAHPHRHGNLLSLPNAEALEEAFDELHAAERDYRALYAKLVDLNEKEKEGEQRREK